MGVSLTLVDVEVFKDDVECVFNSTHPLLKGGGVGLLFLSIVRLGGCWYTFGWREWWLFSNLYDVCPAGSSKVDWNRDQDLFPLVSSG